MNVRKLAVAGVAAGALLLTASCLQPNQHTLVGMGGGHNASRHIDVITFAFDQGTPTASTVHFTATPPAGPSGKPVAMDGNAFVAVNLTPAVARDARNVSTAAGAFYPHGTTNVAEVAQYEDFEGHVGYALGLRSTVVPTITLTRTSTTIIVTVSAP